MYTHGHHESVLRSHRWRTAENSAADPRLDRWLALCRAMAGANGGEPHAGRRLLAWADAAGHAAVAPTASVWCFATPEDRAWWGGLCAERIVGSSLAAQLLDAGLTDAAELAAIADAWHAWAEHPDGWFPIPHAEVVIRIG